MGWGPLTLGWELSWLGWCPKFSREAKPRYLGESATKDPSELSLMSEDMSEDKVWESPSYKEKEEREKPEKKVRIGLHGDEE